jgi:glycosyltransferase involved in cell wall biosynthesis
VLYTNTLKAHVIGGIAGRLCGVPVVWHFRDILREQRLRLPLQWLARCLPHRIIAISKAVAGQFEGSVARKVTVVYNGIDYGTVRRLGEIRQRREILKGLKFPARSRLIGVVGQIAPWKGQDVFLRAAAIIADKLPDARFLVIGGPLFGEDKYYKELQNLAGSLGIGDKVRFTGQRDDVYGLMRSLDVLAHCSILPEPFGRVIVEAMALGVPVAASDGGAVREIITGPEQGIVYRSGDHRQLAGFVIALMDKRRKTKLRAEQSPSGNLRFSLDRTVAGVEAVLRSLCTER